LRAAVSALQAGFYFLSASAGSPWMRAFASRSRPPLRPARTARISARTETAVSAGESAPAARPPGPASRSSSAPGHPAPTRRPPAEELRGCAQRLGRVDRAVDEEPRRLCEHVGEDRAFAELDHVTATTPQRRPLELGIVELLSDALAADHREHDAGVDLLAEG